MEKIDLVDLEGSFNLSEYVKKSIVKRSQNMPSKSKASIVHLRKRPATVDQHLRQEFFF